MYLTEYIANELEPEFGSGFSKRQIELFRQSYRTFPITNTLYSQLSWSQYKLLIRLDSPEQREFYIAETVKNNWTVRQLERQIYSNLHERLLMSNNKETTIPGDNATGKTTVMDSFLWLFFGKDSTGRRYNKDYFWG